MKDDVLVNVSELPAESHSGEAQAAPEKTIACEEALQLLKTGAPLNDVRVDRLVFSGEFSGPIVLRNVILHRPVFKKAVFQSDVSFINCVFDRPTVERRVEFQKSLTLSHSTFIKAQLYTLIVHGDLKADNLKAKGRFFFSKCEFHGSLNFWEANFDCWVDFKSCTFAKGLDFRSVHVHQGFLLSKCQCTGDVLMRGSSFAKKWEASGTRFEGLLDFSKAKLHDYVYLESIEQGEKQQFAFHNVMGERVLIRPEQIAGRLMSEEAKNHHQAMHEYAFLKRTFSGLHRYEEEDWAFYRFKVNQRLAKPRSWARPWTKAAQFCDWLLLDHGCGYCTNPMRAVRTAIMILIGFALIYMLAIDKFYIEKPPFADQDKASWPNRIAFSLTTSVAVFTSGLSGIKDTAKDWMNIPLVVEALLGTLLWGLFIVAFSRKVIR